MSLKLRVLLALGLLLFCLGAVVVKVQVEGARTLAAAQEALASKDRERARQLFLQAGRWYLPWTSVRQDAAAALLDLGDAFRAEGNLQEAVLAYDDARAVFFATEAHPSHPLLDRGNEALADTLAAWQKALASSAEVPALKARYLEKAKARPMPSTGMSLLLGLGFVVWIGAVFVAIRSSGGARLWALGVCGLAFLVWLLALIFLGP